jgi:nucleoside-diphosphate-sugar epimerase
MHEEVLLKRKNALILGGSGRLSGVVARLAMEKYHVYTVTRGMRKVPVGVTALCCDRNDTEKLRNILSVQNVRWDVVIDCICMNREQAMADLEVLPTFTDRLVVVSTDSVYDGRFKRIPENEDGVCVDEAGETKDCTYAGNKRHMEQVFIKDMATGRSGLKTTIFRPGHIYGPGFLPGCFPEHSRQADLAEHILQGKPVRLVGMGTYIIHPIFVDDLAGVLVDCAENEKTYQEVFCIGGPEAIENRTYYEVIAKCLGVKLKIEEIPLSGYLEQHPEYAGHLCHRVYDLSKLRATGIPMPHVKIREGMERMLKSMGYMQ